MFALTSATVRRLIVLARRREDVAAPELDLRDVDDRALHFARLVEDPANAGVVALELAIRRRDRRGSLHVSIYLDDVREADRLVPLSFVLEDLAAREVAAWPAPQDVVPA